MVIVSHDHAFVFLKTRKTGGTSVEMALEPFCRPPGAAVVEKTPTLRSRHGIVGRRMTPRSRWDRLLLRRDWYNHMTAAEVRDRLGAEDWERYRKITALRNPFDLAVSRYHWKLARDGLPEAEDFAETRRRFAEQVQSGQFDGDHGVVHLDGRFVADEVMLFERLAADVAALVQRLVPGAAAVELPHAKKTANRRQHAVAEYYDDASIAAIRRSSGWVFDRFGYPDRP
jgi:hypothetical protein